MFIGHFAVALGAKKAVPKVSLGTLILSATFLDLLWPLFLILGLEHVRIDPGNTAVTPLDFYDYPITHSLLAVLGWSVAFGLVYYAVRKEKFAAWVLGLGVLSHWVLDFFTHRPDLLLIPGESLKVGLGMWYSVPLTLVVEIGLFILGLYLYLRTTTAKDRTGIWSFWGLIVFLAVVYTANVLAGLFGPPPPNAEAIGYAGLLSWLFVPWGYWIDRHRRQSIAPVP